MMASLAPTSLGWICAWCFGLTIASAIIPWVNAEAIVLSLPAFAGSPARLVVLVLVASVGQMTGKCAIYWAGRATGRVASERVDRAISRWRDRLGKYPSKAALLVLESSIVGMPPFYLITLVAGAVRMNFALYLAAGAVGRL